MLRFHRLASHKNSLIIDDFWAEGAKKLGSLGALGSLEALGERRRPKQKYL